LLQLSWGLDLRIVEQTLGSQLRRLDPAIVSADIRLQPNSYQSAILRRIQNPSQIILELSNTKLNANDHLPLKITSGTGAKYLKVPAQIALYKKVWSTKTDLPLGSEVSTADFTLVTANVLALQGAPFDFAAGKYKLLRYLPSGDIVTYWQVSRQYDVVKGDKLTALIDSPEIRLSVTAVALQSGFINDRIGVRYESGKRAVGILVNARTVRVEL